MHRCLVVTGMVFRTCLEDSSTPSKGVWGDPDVTGCVKNAFEKLYHEVCSMFVKIVTISYTYTMPPMSYFITTNVISAIQLN